MLRAIPFTLLLLPSSSSVVTAGHRLPWRQAPPIGYPISGSVHIQGVVCLSQNVSIAEGKGGVGGEGSFSLKNTVTHLSIKWVTSCTQTVPLLSSSVPPTKAMWLCHRYSCYITVLSEATGSVNKQLISAALPPSYSHSYLKTFGSLVSAEMVKRNGIWVHLPGVRDAVCKGEIKSLFDVSSSTQTQLRHLLQQKLPAFQTR